ncbi:hypothetical protein [Caulobacter henricii]|uniref:Uncharacterized protein n=1 Tax=Caulobacter henricii TaxID=69395 RepID=A0A0N7JI78_9CAUL|nr:hypothetical protein [Caulobacter henricii]ALL15434.1 hypothetical protein AQ619_18270 [Caulobacter henricii]
MAIPVFRANNPGWGDMSDYVSHFAKSTEGSDAYSNIISILASGRIEARNPFGVGRARAPLSVRHDMVCFSEVPLHQLSRLASRRQSEHGIVFRKDFVIANGGNPILYAYAAGGLTVPFEALMAQGAGDAAHPIWLIVPFVDAPGAGGSYFFEWEREWRKIGHLNFGLDDVAFLIIPESHHQYARIFFDDAEVEHTGPCYRCPFIDARWGQDQIQEALSR